MKANPEEGVFSLVVSYSDADSCRYWVYFYIIIVRAGNIEKRLRLFEVFTAYVPLNAIRIP